MLKRSVRLIGLLASIAVLGLYLVLVFFNPYSAGSLTPPIFLMILVALLGIVAAWRAKPVFMLIIFAITFIPVGAYMLGSPGLFKWIGIFNLLYLFAGLLALAGQHRN